MVLRSKWMRSCLFRSLTLSFVVSQTRMKACHTKTIIHAPIQVVWNVLADVERYKEWNPTVAKIWGPLKDDQLIYIHHSGLGLIVPVRVTCYAPPYELAWQSWGVFAPLVQGQHYFKLTELTPNQTLLQHGEVLTGAMSAFLPSSLLSKLQSNYAYHNDKLKIIAEQRVAATAE